MGKRNRNRSRGGSNKILISFLVIFGFVGAIAIGAMFMGQGQSITGLAIRNDDDDSGSNSVCPDDGDSTVTLDVQNHLNTTGAETFDTAYVLKGANGDYEDGTDTTAGSETLNCNEEYTISFRSADGSQGDNSKVEKVLIGPGAKINEDGTVTFTPDRSSYTLRVGISQHGIPEIRVFDEDANGYVFDSGGATANSYKTTDVTFQSTANQTALAVGAGGEINYRYDIRSTTPDSNVNDHYILVLVDAATGTWNEPNLVFDGSSLSNVKGSGLTAGESLRYADYEYIYKITDIVDDDEKTLDVNFDARDGVNPGATADPSVDFAVAGKFLSIDGITNKIGAATDASTPTDVFTRYNTTIDVS